MVLHFVVYSECEVCCSTIRITMQLHQYTKYRQLYMYKYEEGYGNDSMHRNKVDVWHYLGKVVSYNSSIALQCGGNQPVLATAGLLLL